MENTIAERKPNENEVLVPVDFPIHHAWGWEKCKMYTDMQFSAHLRRYSNIIMPTSDYNYMVEYINKKQAESAIIGTVRDTYHKALEQEKNGDCIYAEILYNECLELDPKHYETYNRLIIMFHNQGETVKELATLMKATTLFPNVTKWQKRLEKLKANQQ
jgi:hypothetical protein